MLSNSINTNYDCGLTQKWILKNIDSKWDEKFKNKKTKKLDEICFISKNNESLVLEMLCFSCLMFLLGKRFDDKKQNVDFWSLINRNYQDKHIHPQSIKHCHD